MASQYIWRMGLHKDSIEWSQGPVSVSLDETEVHLWRARLDLPPELWARYRDVLRDDERERAGRFRFDLHRGRYVVSRGLLRFLLARYLGASPAGIVIAVGDQGKPELADRQGGLQFNLSHAGGLAVFAFANGRRVGVDIEEESRDVGFRELASRFFSATEQSVLDDVADSDLRTEFYACWTRKEAYIKALGLGVTHGLDNFAVSFGPGAHPAILYSDVDPHAPDRWSMRSFSPAPGYSGAIVVEGSNWALRAFDVPPGAGPDE